MKSTNMTSTNLTHINLLFLVALLALPVQLAAQHTRYKLIDIGTFGGPTSQTNGESVVITNEGTVVGGADTSTPCPYFSGLISPAFKWQNGVMTELALLPGGCFSFADATNSHGLIVGLADNGLIDPLTDVPELRAVVWQGGQIIDLGTLGGSNSVADAVNNRGQVIGVAENTIPDPFDFGGTIIEGLPSPTEWHAFLWQDGVMRDLGTLGGPDSAVAAVNERGQIAGISFTNSTPNPTTGFPTLAPFLWQNGKMLDLGTLGGSFGVSAHLNNRGQVVGFSDLAGDLAAHPYLWDGGRMTDLGVLGGTFGLANWINNAGEVVGGSTTPDDQFHAVLWTHGGTTDLGTVDGDSCSIAFVNNSKGQIVGQSFNCDGSGEPRAVLWDKRGPIIDLNAFVPPGSDLQLVESHFINDRGEIVVAGVLPNGDEHAVVLIPCGPNDSEVCEDHSDSRAKLTQANPAAAAQTSTNVTHGRLTPETLAALRSRLARRYHIRGFGTPRK